MSAIQVLTIKNSMHQLDALPIGESINILFDKQPLVGDLQNTITLSRLQSNQVWPHPGDLNAKQIHFIKDTYGTVAVDFIITVIGSQWNVEVKPKEPLYTNAKYFLFVNSGIREKYYSVNKVVSFGSSNIWIDTIDNANLTDDAVYDLYITQTSSIIQGENNIRYSLFKNSVAVSTNVQLNINSAQIALNANTSIRLNKSTPFINNERYTITLVSAEKSTTSRLQNITTFTDSQVIKSEDNPSGRLQYQDVVGFYNQYGFGQSAAPVQEATDVIKFTVKYIDLDKIIITSDKEFDENSITEQSFTASFSPAFNSYLLSKLDLYSSNSQYIIRYRILSTTEILIEIKDDVDNIITNSDKYIVQILT